MKSSQDRSIPNPLSWVLKAFGILALAVGMGMLPLGHSGPGLIASQALADQTDPRLDQQFAILQTTDSGREAAAAEARIWELWQESENTASEQLLREAGRAMRYGDYRVALDLTSQLIDQAPGFAEAWNRRATIRYIMRDFEGSLADISEVLELEPRHFGALSGRGLVLIAMGREREAIAAFDAALAVHPHLPGARANKAALIEKLGEREI